MEEKKNSIRAINLSATTYEAPTTSSNRRWVEYGQTNQYPTYLKEIYESAPTHKALVTTIAQLIYGTGLEANVGQEAIDALISESAARQASFDLKLYGYAVLDVRIGSDNKLLKILTSPASCWRTGVPGPGGEPTHWWYSADWTKLGWKSYRPYKVPVYSETSEEKRQVYIVRPLEGKNEPYPIPDYSGSIKYAQLEAEIGEFHLSNILNGLFPGLLINFNDGVPSDEEQDDIEFDVKQKWGGPGKAGKFILSFNRDKDSAPTVEAIDIPDIDKQYEFLSKETTAKIMIGHRVTSPILFGIRDGAGLGNNAEELKTSFTLFEAMVILPFKRLITSAYEEILQRNGINTEITLGSLKPIEFATDAVKEEAEIEDEVVGDVEKPEGMKELSSTQLSTPDIGPYKNSTYKVQFAALDAKGRKSNGKYYELDEAMKLNSPLWERKVFIKA